jgi:putative oxidoreductase
MRRVVLALLRMAVGVGFVAAGAGKFRDHAAHVADFAHWNLPSPDTAVYVIGGLEAACGVLVLLGLATRLGAALLCIDMLGALATAGRIDGGAHLVAPAILAVGCLVLVARGGGRWQLLDRIDPPR